MRSTNLVNVFEEESLCMSLAEVSTQDTEVLQITQENSFLLGDDALSSSSSSLITS